QRLAARLPGPPAHDHVVTLGGLLEVAKLVGQVPGQLVVAADDPILCGCGDQGDAQEASSHTRPPARQGRRGVVGARSRAGRRATKPCSRPDQSLPEFEGLDARRRSERCSASSLAVESRLFSGYFNLSSVTPNHIL